MENKKRTTIRGFTLLELAAVVTVLVILAGVVIPIANGLIEDAKVARTVDLYRKIADACRRYYTDTGAKPARLDSLYSSTGAPPGWNGPYIDRPIGSADNPFETGAIEILPNPVDFNLAPGMPSTVPTWALALQVPAIPATAADKIDIALDENANQMNGLSQYVFDITSGAATMKLMLLPTNL